MSEPHNETRVAAASSHQPDHPATWHETSHLVDALETAVDMLKTGPSARDSGQELEAGNLQAQVARLEVTNKQLAIKYLETTLLLDTTEKKYQFRRQQFLAMEHKAVELTTLGESIARMMAADIETTQALAAKEKEVEDLKEEVARLQASLKDKVDQISDIRELMEGENAVPIQAVVETLITVIRVSPSFREGVHSESFRGRLQKALLGLCWEQGWMFSLCSEQVEEEEDS
ncbi:hypothetical protein QBC39DRAFT_358603 [Podospora conica]|nr:hypothetical protein QBC39DRAFT_358603 [Schizothecium conicum]